ncbi:uncharacterized protein LOC141618078 [Silene latifolia]|uniref:uncharacterized protein LOC141618078 n=1 Tax=Silene latifolia TaxID=37657 RepID=UPI003D77D5C5
MQQAVLGSGYFLFDNKPLIIRPWQPDIDLEKEEIKCVPAWIRLKGLPLKFWGQSLPKIANLVGKYVKSDAATESKTRLGFARLMVELKVDQIFPSNITFMDEKQNKIKITVEYEWKPSTCNKCKQLGHEQNNCRKGLHKKVKKIQKVWRPVQVKEIQAPIASDNPAQDTSTPLNKPIQISNGSISPIRLPRQGIDVILSIQGSPTYKEVLSGQSSPKEGSVHNGNEPPNLPP